MAILAKTTAALLLGFSLVPSAVAAIVPTSAGDGYFHDETGSSYDYFDGGSQGLSAYYTYWGTSDTLQFNTGYIQFSLASIPAGDPVFSATLSLYLTERHYSSESPSAGFVKHVANSSAANGNASQKLGGTEQVVEIKDQSLGWLVLDVTSYIQNDLAAGYSYSCFSLNPNTSGYFRDAGFTVSSSESAYAPKLTVVPEPTVGLLAGGGLVLLALSRKRK